MSKILINQYYQNLDRTLQFGKSRNEQSIRNHFWALLNEYARKFNYEVIPEVAVMGTKGKKVHPDGTVKNLWGLDIGLWESKDEKDDIEAEIDSKIKKGYPLTNILFEDSDTAILFQRGEEVNRIKVRDADKLHEILEEFLSFKSETVYKFEDAIEKFKADIPVIVETLRKKILEIRENNEAFLAAQEVFLELCKAEINPDITLEDIREMMIQHILTSDIFTKIFDDAEFHHHNTIAAELEKLIGILFSYAERRNLLDSIEHYYEAISATAASITDHHEKQKFLKVLYENFYKVYNPKAADRLGVIYTPNEIVQFMVQSTNYLLYKHFGKTLADKNVEILDPATGTGTFICEIIENAIPKDQLDYKYKNEIHANEVAILPYYIANLNIEYTFKQKMQYYVGFPNLCFVDTLDNISALAFAGRQHEMFGMTSENTERIHRQNTRKISVFIGNPPYNANQKNENENNKNREYHFIDKRIKNTYIKQSTAQKTKAYDMFARFYRWTSDRLDKNGIIAFITNNSFINSKSFDGFRKSIQNEFSHCSIIDLGGNIRENYGKKDRPIGNVFDIQVGVAIMFLIKIEKQDSQCYIEYTAIQDELRKTEKLDWLKNNQIENIHFSTIHPDNNNNWINLTNENDWDSYLLLVDKRNKVGYENKTVFDIFSNGLASNRDEWVYDFNKNTLIRKMKYFHEEYNHEIERWIKYKKESRYIDKSSDSNPVVDKFLTERNLIKWSKMIKRDKLRKEKVGTFFPEDIIQSLYRPYVKKYLCDGYIPIDVRGNLLNIFHNCTNNKLYENKAISFYGFAGKSFHCIGTQSIFDLHFTGDTQCLPLFRYDQNNNKNENITEWGLKQFVNHYQDDNISKEGIFHYTYAVLHNPAYRIKYELNLKRELPRIPYYENFHKWAAWGKTLMDLHINYETANPWPLERHDFDVKAEAKRQKEMFSKVEEVGEMYVRQPKVKVKLKADKTAGIIEIDELTFLRCVPKEAWEYKLGNRSALEWVLDQYKEKKPKDPTIAEKFNTYKFANYKEQVIDLLRRICTVSVETVNIIKQMELEK